MTTTFHAFRVEQEDGSGPYFSASLPDDFSLPYSPSKHPDPFEDGIDKMKPYDICAFKDYQQALEWFDEDMVDFLKIEGGWFLSTYRVEESTTKYGNRQILIDSEKMVLVNRDDIEILNFIREL